MATTPRVLPWTETPAPGIELLVPANTVRALKHACRAVDQDIELRGAVSAATVDQVRAALALLRAA